MFATKRSLILVGALTVVALFGAAADANACWRCGGGYAAYGCGSSCGFVTTSCYSCCIPTYSCCYSPTCYDTCYGSSWYVGVRPGPVRRAVLGPYRYYYAGGPCCYGSYSGYGYAVTGYGYGVSAYPYAPGCCGGGVTVTSPTVAKPESSTPSTTAPTLAPTAPTPAAPSTMPLDMPSPPSMTPPPPSITPPSITPPSITPPSITPPSITPPSITPPSSTPGSLLPPSSTPGSLLPPPGGPSNPLYAPPSSGSRTSLGPTANESGLLTIYVPADAKVTVNGYETKSTGSRRQYVSYGLQAGMSYKYHITAQVDRNGKSYEEEKDVVLLAGGNEKVAFGFNIASAESLAANP